MTSAGSASPEIAAAQGAAEIIIVDCSGSMGAPKKMIQARQATAAAIEAIRDGVAFAVVAGTGEARQVWPDSGLIIAEAAEGRPRRAETSPSRRRDRDRAMAPAST